MTNTITKSDAARKMREFAIQAHGDQKYGTDTPYVAHLDDVAELAAYFYPELHKVMQDQHDQDDEHSGYIYPDGEFLEDALCLAYSHDLLEDTSATEDQIRDIHNWVGLLTTYLTDEPGANRKERKRNTWHKIRQHPISVFIKLCDRLANTEMNGKIDMYRKEFPLFEAALYVPGQFPKLWERLNKATFG
jgi:(p)ppGpp synthase/HD superfamily hydrolase